MESAGTCSICCEYFDHKEHLPLLLNCGHTFCKECLRSPTFELRQARLKFEQNPSDESLRKYEERKNCLLRCSNGLLTDNLEKISPN